MKWVITKVKIGSAAMRRQMKADEEIWRAKMSGYFMRAKKPILKSARELTPLELSLSLDSLIPYQPVFGIYGTLYNQLGFKYFKKTRNELIKTAKATPLGSWPSIIDQFVNTIIAKRITGVVDNTRKLTQKEIQSVIDLGLQEGLSIDEMQIMIESKVDALWINMRKNRARTIARTESVTTANRASFMGAQDAANSGLEVTKAWLNTRGMRTRPDHAEMDSQDYIPINQPFNVGGFSMMCPGDNSLGAPASEIVNCRCTMVYRSKLKNVINE